MSILDFLFGWLLTLQSDLAIISLALMTGLIMIVVRKWTTNQDLLARAVADNRRLGQLIKEAKRAGNKEALARLRLTKAKVGMLKFKQEGKPLLVSLVPIALLATWAFARMEFLPPKPGEIVTVEATAPLSAGGEVVHLVPQPGVTAVDGWVKQFVPRGSDSVASWRVRMEPVLQANQLTARRAGGEAPVTFQLRERRLFGLIPGVPSISLAAWLIGYLVIVIPIVPGLKKLLRIF